MSPPPRGWMSLDQCKCGELLLTAVGTLFKRLPKLRLAVPLEEVTFTPLGGDVGIEKLPVVW